MNKLDFLLYGVVFGLVACGNTDAPPQHYGSLLNDLTEQVILPEHQAFVTQADALVAALQTLSDRPDTESLDAAQASWRSTRQAFRVLDALHFGPDYTLRITERIDVSPADAAGIEALVTTKAIDDQAVAEAGGRKKGFLGLEYLLFPDPSDALPAPALSDERAAAVRRELAISMADEIAASARQMNDAWDPQAGGFATQLVSAGAGSSEYPSQRAAVDALAGGVAYALEWILSIRLGPPLGKKTGGMPLPALDPTRRSDSATLDVQSTLLGVSALYDGNGFSSAVTERSAKLDQTVKTELTDAQASVSAIDAPFADTLVMHTAVVQAAYKSAQTLRNTWDTDVSSALGATVKIENDGD